MGLSGRMPLGAVMVTGGLQVVKDFVEERSRRSRRHENGQLPLTANTDST